MFVAFLCSLEASVQLGSKATLKSKTQKAERQQQLQLVPKKLGFPLQ